MFGQRTTAQHPEPKPAESDQVCELVSLFTSEGVLVEFEGMEYGVWSVVVWSLVHTTTAEDELCPIHKEWYDDLDDIPQNLQSLLVPSSSMSPLLLLVPLSLPLPPPRLSPSNSAAQSLLAPFMSIGSSFSGPAQFLGSALGFPVAGSTLV